MRIPFLLLIFLIRTISYGQVLTHCDVYQFEGIDSSKKEIALEQTFNEKGQVLTEKYNDYKVSRNISFVSGTYFYLYKDTLLLTRTFFDLYSNDSTKRINFYNNKNQLVQYDDLKFERRVKPEANKGFGRSGGCVVLESDFEKDRTWKLEGQMLYFYDNKGKLAINTTTRNQGGPIKKETWTYDSLGRVLTDSLFEEDIFTDLEAYSYFNEGYQSIHTSYDNGGKPEYLKKHGDGYSPQYIFNYLLNAKGQIIEEMLNYETGELGYVKKTYYNAAGRIVRRVYYNNKGEQELTHIYVYR